MTAEQNKTEWAIELLKQNVQGNYINYTNVAFDVLRLSGKQWDEIVKEAKNESRK